MAYTFLFRRNLANLCRCLERIEARKLKEVVQDLGTPEMDIQAVETIGMSGLMNITEKLKEFFKNKKTSGSQIVDWLKENQPICNGSRFNTVFFSFVFFAHIFSS